jgi:hypothetical protein
MKRVPFTILAFVVIAQTHTLGDSRRFIVLADERLTLELERITGVSF